MRPIAVPRLCPLAPLINGRWTTGIRILIRLQLCNPSCKGPACAGLLVPCALTLRGQFDWMGMTVRTADWRHRCGAILRSTGRHSQCQTVSRMCIWTPKTPTRDSSNVQHSTHYYQLLNDHLMVAPIIAFHCRPSTFHCLSLTVHCLSLTCHCFSLTLHNLATALA